MRVIVFTGMGGAGVSTLAAATAAAIANSGRRTLAFGVGPGPPAARPPPWAGRPTPVAADLWALEGAPGAYDAPDPFLAWLRDLFAWRDMDETVADDIAGLPGLVDLARFLALEEHIAGEEFDAVVVDCPPLRHSVDLLAAVDAAARSLNQVFPPREPTVFDPFLRALSGSSVSGDEVYEGGREILRRFSELRQTLAERESATVRLVLSADRRSLAEVQRGVTALSLFAYSVDAAICNRILPEDAGPWWQARRDDERVALDDIRESLAPLPVLDVVLQARAASGLERLASLAGLAYGRADPAEVLHRGPGQGFSQTDGRYVLSIDLPFVQREDIALERQDDALIVHLGGRSRAFELPPEVRKLDGVSSALDGETLRVTFSDQDSARATKEGRP